MGRWETPDVPEGGGPKIFIMAVDQEVGQRGLVEALGDGGMEP
jgi:hypothetical protein